MELSLPLTDATALQDALQGGRVSARDVAAAALRRARAAESDQHGPALGAFVHLESGEAADERATALDALLKDVSIIGASPTGMDG